MPEQQSEESVEMEYLPSNSSPRLLGWFLASLSTLLFLSVFYVGDIVSSAYYHIFTYRDFASSIEHSERPDQLIAGDILSPFPDMQAKKIRRVGSIYSLIHKGEIERAEQVLLSGNLPEVPSKYRLAAVLDWIDENKTQIEKLERATNLARQQEKDFIRAFDLNEAQRSGLHIFDSLEVFPPMLAFDNSIGNDIMSFFVPAGDTENLSIGLLGFYRHTLQTREEQHDLLEQTTTRRQELLRIAKEKTKILMTKLALPQFDERSQAVYREASLHSESIGITLPALESSDT